jgi:hypothetical protein
MYESAYQASAHTWTARKATVRISDRQRRAATRVRHSEPRYATAAGARLGAHMDRACLAGPTKKQVAERERMLLRVYRAANFRGETRTKREPRAPKRMPIERQVAKPMRRLGWRERGE